MLFLLSSFVSKLPQPVVIAGHGLRGRVQSLVTNTTDIRCVHLMLLQDRLEIHFSAAFGAVWIFDVSDHLLNVANQYLDERTGGVEIGFGIDVCPTGDLLYPLSHLTEVSSLTEGLFCGLVILLLASFARSKDHPSLLAIPTHDPEMPDFQSAAADLVGLAAPGNEVGVDMPDIVDLLILAQMTLETVITFDLSILGSNG